MSFENILREASAAGADTIELISEEMVEGFANPSERCVTWTSKPPGPGAICARLMSL